MQAVEPRGRQEMNAAENSADSLSYFDLSRDEIINLAQCRWEHFSQQKFCWSDRGSQASTEFDFSSQMPYEILWTLLSHTCKALCLCLWCISTAMQLCFLPFKQQQQKVLQCELCVDVMVLFHWLGSISHAKFRHCDESFRHTNEDIHRSSKLQAPLLEVYNEVLSLWYWFKITICRIRTLLNCSSNYSFQ